MGHLNRLNATAGLLLLLSVSLIFACNQDLTEKEDLFSTEQIVLFLGSHRSILTDNNDGTLTWRIIALLDLVRAQHIVKKCVQGQVYRAAENDCRGTGSAADGYGAQIFQYCDADNDSCNGPVVNRVDEEINGDGNSEAFNTCAADTTAGLQWEVGNTSGIFSPDVTSSVQLDLPDGQYWRRESHNSIQAQYSQRPAGGGYDLKTNRRYVICRQRID